MLSVNMNRDVEQYQEAVVSGMNAKQTVFAALTIFIGAIVVVGLNQFLGISLNIAVYLSIPFLFPIVMIGFGTQNGISWFQRTKVGLRKQGHVYSYHSKECSNEYEMEASKEYEREQCGESEFEREKQKIKRMALISMVGLIVIAILVVLAKQLIL